MNPFTNTLTRSSSSDSSALSNILVAAVSSQTQEPDTMQDNDSMSEDAGPVSTPPTSLQDTASNGSAKAGAGKQLERISEEGRRPRRVRSGVSTYNLKELSDLQQFEEEGTGKGRNVSGLTGRTLVQDDGEEDADEAAVVSKGKRKAVELDEEEQDVEERVPQKLHRRASVKDRVKKVAGKVGAALGKRKRGMVEAGKRKLGKSKQQPEVDDGDEEIEADTPKKTKWLKELDMGTRGVLDEMDLDEEYEAPPQQRPAKKAKTSGKDFVKESSKPVVPTHPTAAPVKSVSGKGMKKWQREGLYVGQETGFDATQVGGGRKKLQKKSRPGTAGSDSTTTTNTNEPVPAPDEKKKSFITLPMFAYLDKTRNFTIPFDIYAPSAKKGDEKPKDWHKVNRNRLVGEAKDLWAKVEKLPHSACTCPKPAEGEMSCEDDCINRVMQYECNEDNCRLPADQCSNRAFAELAARMKKGGAFDVGVEVLKTDKRGFGVRSCRSFAPGQIIMEYTGEIISEGECQRRMREEYKDKQCYYLMELERGLIIDGTKGSIARFINHSCAPNCEVRMVKVNGTPRMAVFAGDSGVMTGEELTYDYNFDNFGTTQQQCFCGATSCRGFLSKRLNAAEMKKLAKEEEVKKRKAAEEAAKAAEREGKRRKVVEGRGSGWRGWIAVDDPETRERLREEKRVREEAERNSGRALRMARRRGSLPAAPLKEEGNVEAGRVKKEPRRRRTVQIHQETKPESPAPDRAAVAVAESETSGEGIEVAHTHRASSGPKDEAVEDEDLTPAATATKSQQKPQRSASHSSSKFHEEFTPDGKDKQRPLSAQTMNTTITRKTEVSISTTTSVLQSNAHALSDTTAAASAEDGEDAEEEVPAKKAKKSKERMEGESKLKRTASKSKEVFKRAFKGGSSSEGGAKLKQTTLSFGRAG